MTNELLISKINDLLKDTAFANDLEKTDSDHLIELFQKYGVDMTEDGLSDIYTSLYPNKEELCEEDLEEVSGGKAVIVGPTYNLTRLIVELLKKNNKKSVSSGGGRHG